VPLLKAIADKQQWIVAEKPRCPTSGTLARPLLSSLLCMLTHFGSEFVADTVRRFAAFAVRKRMYATWR